MIVTYKDMIELEKRNIDLRWSKKRYIFVLKTKTQVQGANFKLIRHV